MAAARLLGKAAATWAAVVGWLGRKPEYLTIHHSDSGPEVTAAEIDSWHRARWGTGIAYHWVIERAPAVKAVTGRPDRDERGRPNPVQGAAAWGLNGRSLAVCVVGNFESEMVRPDVWTVLVDVCATVCRRHGIRYDRIIGHCDVAAIIKDPSAVSSCPGRNLRALLPRLRDEVRQRLAVR